MYKDMEWLIFGTVRFFRENFIELFSRAPRADNFNGADQLWRLRLIFTAAETVLT